MSDSWREFPIQNKSFLRPLPDGQKWTRFTTWAEHRPGSAEPEGWLAVWWARLGLIFKLGLWAWGPGLGLRLRTTEKSLSFAP